MRDVWILGCVLVLAACGRNFRGELSGDVPFQLENRTNGELWIHITPEGEYERGRPWNHDALPRGGTVNYGVKPGVYLVWAESTIAHGPGGTATWNTADGPGRFVVADQPIDVPPGVQLLLRGSRATCMPDGAQVDYEARCCSGRWNGRSCLGG